MPTLPERIAQFLGRRDYLAKEPVVKPEPEVTPHVKETAWNYSSLIYSTKDFPRYNPDDLISHKGYAVYKKMMLDEQVKACVKFKRDAIISRDWYFELPEETELPEGEADRRVAIMTKALASVRGSVSDALAGVMSAMYNGFSITEPILKPFQYDGKTYWGYGKFKLKPFDTFYFTPDEYGEIVKFQQRLSGAADRDLDIEDFIHFVCNPDVDEHYGQSDLREAYRAYFSKDVAIKFRNIWLERHAGGARWVQPTKEGGANLIPGSQEYARLQDMLTNWQTPTGAILPAGLEMIMQYPSNNVAYKETIDDCDLQIARALLVPNLMGITPSGQTGSYSQSDTQLEAFFWTLDAEAERLEDCLNEQAFRKLGQLNFGDDDIPLFKFKPVSDRKMMEIIKTWKELVAGKAVQATDTDEARIRELLDMPEAGEPINQPQQVGPDGKPIDQPGGVPGAQGKEPDGGAAGGKDKGKQAGDSDAPDETVIGRNRISIEGAVGKRARMRAAQRVDFAVIKQRAELAVMENAARIGRVMGELALDLFKTIEANNLVQESKLEEVNALQLDGSRKVKLRRAVSAAIKAGWEIGMRHAATEVDKAKGAHFSRTANMERVALIGAEFFDLKSFAVTGKLTDDALNKIKTVIINGVKNGKSTKQVEDEIIEAFARDGMLDRQTVLDYFGEATDSEANPQARLETIVRTNSFEAINEARYAYFTDPALEGFVEALEYSAILDDRTTDVCACLDGVVKPVDSDYWDEYTPPNHFNCRSLLIPVTTRDTWAESDKSCPLPQEGFA
jgi:SPP1 gp7 family putative phage head morphogenesis protein